ACAENGFRVAGAERSETSETFKHVAVDFAQAEGRVNPQPRDEIFRTQNVIRPPGEPVPEFGHARFLQRHTGRLLVTTELEEHVLARLERAQQIEVANAATGSVRDNIS